MTQVVNIEQNNLVIDVVSQVPNLNVQANTITLDVASGGVVPAAVDTTLQAATNISALRAITTDANGKAVYAEPATLASAMVIGVSKTSAVVDDNLLIQTSGTMNDNAWNWTKGLIFLGADGTLTQSPPGAGAFLAVLGRAITDKTIIIDIDTLTEMA